MKKAIALFLGLVLILSICAGCGSSSKPAESNAPAQSGSTGTSSSEKPAESGNSAQPEAAAPVKDTLVIAIETEGNDFDPQNSGLNISSSGVTRNVYDTLVRNDEAGNVYGVLATDWEWVNEMKAIDFKLRENVYFTNGELFTADDVAYTYQVRFPTSSMGKSESTFDFENMEIVNDHEVIIPLKKVSSDALNQLTHMKYSIMNREACEAAGDQIATQPVGTGAYILTEWVPGDRMVLTVNENYWGDQPQLREITLRIIKENAQAEIELESGNVDAAIFYNGNNDVLRVMNGEIPGLKTITQFSAVQALRFNYTKDYANNLQVRQALNYAVNREAIVKADSQGLNTPAYQLGIPGLPCYIEEYNTDHPYPYDPDKARELLKEAGYEDLVLELYTDTGKINHDDAEMLKNMFAAVGVTLNIHALDAGTVVPIVIQGQEDDCFIGFGISDWTGSLLQRFRSASDPNYSPDFEHHGQSDVYNDIYQLFLQAESTTDRDEAIRLMREAAKMEAELALDVPIASTNTFINCVENLHIEWFYGDPYFINWYYE